jgi:hypothetical protein
MTIRLSIDRFEGDRKQVAVLLTDDGTPINFPKALLPKGARPGDVLTLRIERDTAAVEWSDEPCPRLNGGGFERRANGDGAERCRVDRRRRTVDAGTARSNGDHIKR